MLPHCRAAPRPGSVFSSFKVPTRNSVCQLLFPKMRTAFGRSAAKYSRTEKKKKLLTKLIAAAYKKTWTAKPNQAVSVRFDD